MKRMEEGERRGRVHKQSGESERDSVRETGSREREA